MLKNNIKTCAKCKNTKSLECFGIHRYRKDGRNHTCKECLHLNYLENKEKISIYYKEKRLEKNGGVIRVRVKKDKPVKKRVKRTKEEKLEIRRKWNKTPQGIASRKNTKHKRRVAIKDGDITTKQLALLIDSANHCYWCNKKIDNYTSHIDHYVPISKGGKHTISNIVISCGTCNKRKQSKDPIEFANLIGKLF